MAGAGGAAGGGAGGMGGGGGAAGSGGGGGGGGPTGPVTYYKDVLPILNRDCLICHGADGPGHPRLDDPNTASSLASSIQAAIQSGQMPPYPAADKCNSYLDERRISDADKALVYKWAGDGGPLGDPATKPVLTPPPPPIQNVNNLGMPDRHLIGGPFTPTFPGSAGTDDIYWCHVVDPQISGDTADLIAARLSPGNKDLVHHIILYRDEGGTRVADHKGASGFECDGAPGEFLHGWVPGAQDLVFPQGIGMSLKSGDKLLMQVHYHRHDGVAVQPDTSITDLYFAKSPTPQHAFVVWSGTPLFTVPPKTMNYAVNSSCSVTSDWRVLAVAPHMHTHATKFHMSFTKGGAESCFVDIPRWDFGWQLAYFLQNPVTLKVGDKINTSCTYDNMEDRSIAFGESTNDEMCFGFTYVVAASKPTFAGPINWFGGDSQMMCAN